MHLRTRGVAMKLGVGLLASGAMSAVFLLRPVPPLPTPAPPEAFAVLLHRIGLEPRSMAAAGIGAQQTESMLARVRPDAPEHLATVAAADEAYAQTYAEVDRLEGLVLSGTGSSETTVALATARASLLEADSQRRILLQQILATAAHDADPETVIRLRQIASSTAFDDAIEFQATDRNQADEVRLRDALACERLAARESGEVVPAAAAILAIERAHADVAAARARLDANVAGVIQAWNNALRNP